MVPQEDTYKYVAGFGLMDRPETSLAISSGPETVYAGTRAGFLQWGVTMLANPTWRPELRHFVERAIHDAKKAWLKETRSNQ